jgi:hypothetical protein
MVLESPPADPVVSVVPVAAPAVVVSPDDPVLSVVPVVPVAAPAVASVPAAPVSALDEPVVVEVAGAEVLVVPVIAAWLATMSSAPCISSSPRAVRSAQVIVTGSMALPEVWA